MTLKKQAIMPKLYDAKGNINKQWNVYYSFLNDQTGKMQRFQVTEGINKIKTKKGRYEFGQKLITKYRRKLKNGWNPFENGKYLYQDTVSYAKEAGKDYQIESKAFDFCLEQYLSDVLADHEPNVRVTTFQAYQAHLRGFIKWLDKNDLSNQEPDKFTTSHAQKFLNDLKLHNKTRQAYRNNLKRLFNLLINQEILDKNPFDGTELPKANTTNAKRAFRTIERAKLKKYFIENNLTEIWAVVQFMFYCFIRPKELRFLKVNDIDIDNEKIQMRSAISKNKKLQYVAIPKQFLPFLTEYLMDKSPKDFVFGEGRKPRGEEYFRRKHKEVLDTLGFENDVSLYSWKHTGVVEFYTETKDMKALQQQLRHHSLDEVNTYLHSLGLMDNETAKNSFPTL